MISFDGILLRPWRHEDSGALFLIADNKKIADNLRDGFPNPYSYDDAIKWLNMVIPENSPVKFFAIEVNGSLAGSIGIVTKTDIYRKNVEIGYYVAEEFWGKGIATKAIKAVTKYAFETFDIVRVYAEPFAQNISSRRVLEKAGFKLEATFRSNVVKNGLILDSCIYSILKDEYLLTTF